MLFCIISDWQQLLRACLCANRCRRPASPVRGAPAAAAPSGAALRSSVRRATAVRVSAAEYELSPDPPNRLVFCRQYWLCDLASLSFFRSPECCWISWAGEHAGLDFHCGQHLCFRRSCGLSCRHFQIDLSKQWEHRCRCTEIRKLQRKYS